MSSLAFANATKIFPFDKSSYLFMSYMSHLLSSDLFFKSTDNLKSNIFSVDFHSSLHNAASYNSLIVVLDFVIALMYSKYIGSLADFEKSNRPKFTIQ